MLTRVFSVPNTLPVSSVALAMLIALTLPLWSVPAWSQTHTLSASVDRQEVSIEETLTLSVRYSGQVQGDQPDFSLLQENFDVIGQRRSNQISTINGVMSAFTEWTLTLAPKTTGQLLIPSFKYSGSFSDAIQITVTEAKAPPGQVKDIFIETRIDQSQVYVQEQVLLTYRLYTVRSIDSMDAEALTIDGVRIEELPQARFQRRIDGINYGVLEVSYALFPQTSETFTIPPLRWTLRVATGQSRGTFGFGSSRYELKRILTEEKAVVVAPNPAIYPAGEIWLPAKNLELSQQWSSPPSDFRVGEPLTRTITLRAEGLTAAQLPPLPVEENPQGYRLYPDQPEQNNRTNADGVTGSRTETMAVVPDRAGEITLPAIKVSWWDTNVDELRTAELPAQIIHVAANGSAAGQAGQPVDNSSAQIERTGKIASEEAPSEVVEKQDTIFWQVTTVIFAFLWLLFAWLWWRARQLKSESRPDKSLENGDPTAAQEKRSFRALNKAVQHQDLANLRLALLRWGACRWPDRQPRSLQDLASRLDDSEITGQLAVLDAALYGKTDSEPAAAELVENIRHWRTRPTETVAAQQPLKPLY